MGNRRQQGRGGVKRGFEGLVLGWEGFRFQILSWGFGIDRVVLVVLS